MKPWGGEKGHPPKLTDHLWATVLKKIMAKGYQQVELDMLISEVGDMYRNNLLSGAGAVNKYTKDFSYSLVTTFSNQYQQVRKKENHGYTLESFEELQSF